ncbi:uncharacterized protein LOC125646397 [Ostrea edulis]|uniref:uncharacterized protein LOC125646397 n=1 Tax=Ostrea edulis TaxID=37623 RepID=UPI0024AF4E0D|nr:uncharacterized protein LOC125646397 [Ostrea edulis]
MRQLLVLFLMCLTGGLPWLSIAQRLHHCPNDCHWNGHCNPHSGLCTCYDGFYNKDCSGDCGCGGHGVCKADHTCQCDEGWKWSVLDRKCVWDCQCPNGQSCMAPSVCSCSRACQYGTCWDGQCECWEGYTGETCGLLNTNTMSNRNSSLGVNLGGLTYYSSEIKFVDVAKESSNWVTQRWGNHSWDTHEHATINMRSDGYPASLPDDLALEKLMLRSLSHTPTGVYTILYDGEGDIELNLVHYQKIYSGKGRILINVTIGQSGLGIRLLRTNPANPLHNLRVILPGFEARHEQFPFYPLFLESLARYSEFRYMDFLHTNAHTPEPTTWKARKTTADHTQGGSDGGALEYAILLSNQMGASPWFNMPHAADDDFIMKFATQVKQSLRPDLRVYVEYSNEVWNGIFRQNHYATEKGLSLGLDTAAWKAGFKYYNKRSHEMGQIWKSVYGASFDKLVLPWAWQTGYEEYTRQALEDLGTRVHDFTALAITGYFTCDLTSKYMSSVRTMSYDEVLSICTDYIQNKTRSSFSHYMGVAKDHDLHLLMYEGGQHIVEKAPYHTDVTSKLTNINRNVIMETLNSNLLNIWNEIVIKHSTSPGGLFNYFASCGKYSQYGSWGILEYTGQPFSTVPKYRAVQAFITSQSLNTEVAPKCSFVDLGNISYGCFLVGNRAYCGSSTDRGQNWSSFQSIHDSVSRLVADGFNSASNTLFVRGVHPNMTFYYYTINIHNPRYTVETNFDYYEKLSDVKVIRRLPNGVFKSLNLHLNCQ